MNKIAMREQYILQKIAATRWKREWEKLSDKNKGIILKKVSDPNELAQKSENTLKTIAAKQGYKVYTSLKNFENDTGRKSDNFTVDYKNKIVVADKNNYVQNLISSGLPLDFAQRDGARKQMHEAFETLSEPYNSTLRYATHAEPGVMHRSSAYSARFPKIDREIEKTVQKNQKVMDAEQLLSIYSGASKRHMVERNRVKAMHQKSPSVYDDMLNYGVDYAGSPVINKPALRKHRETFKLTGGIPMSIGKIQEMKRKRKLIENLKRE